MGLSPAQAAALADKQAQILVAAGAGSGKTRLLVAAVVQALIEDELPVERLVAVTFTRKAGAELASRVRDALRAAGRADLAHDLDAATLGTIDSLCRRVVKDEAIATGVDPACTVLEAETADLLKMEMAGQAWEVVVSQADPEGLGLIASHGPRMRDDMVALYDRLRGAGQSEPRVEIEPGPSKAQRGDRLALAVNEAMAVARDVSKPSASLESDLEKLRGCLEWLEGPEERRVGEEGLRASMDLFPSRKNRVLAEHFAEVRRALAEYRCSIAESVLAPLAEVFNSLLAEFHRGYTAAKSERGLVDFADLGLKARDLLVEGRGAGRDGDDVLLAGSFLLVDEFQDTNELQCAILSGLGAERVLMVGDERQSIYRFRGADVDVFTRRRKALEKQSGSAPSGALHRLDVNYRSSPEILQFINHLFSHADFFGESFVQLTPDPDRVPMLPVGGDKSAPSSGPAASAAVEVLVAERGPAGDDEDRPVSMRKAEADALAAHIRGLLDHEGWRQRDVVLLLPTQIQVELYRQALLTHGMDVYVVRGKGYYTQEEVTDIGGLLRVLVSPHDDLALLTVLRSPMVGLSDDALYLLGRERRSRHAKSLWEVIRSGWSERLAEDDREALATFAGRMRQLRIRVGRPGLSRLIDDCASMFDYDLCLLSAPEGLRRFANLRKLMRLADQFESVSGPDLAAFLSVIRVMGEVGDREGSAPTLGEGEDVVRVMTIHQAKGLEFPVVVLAGLGSDIHRPDISTFAIGSDGRVGMFLKRHRNRTYEDCDPHWGPAAEIAMDELRREREEDIRLLYVAMTRAQERLVLVGARPLKDKLEGSRIGSVVLGLGLGGFPNNGETLTIAGSSATVMGVPASPPISLESKAHVDKNATPREETSRSESHQSSPGVPVSEEASSCLRQRKSGRVPERISFSALASYQRCPRQFYLERVLELAFIDGGLRIADSEQGVVPQRDDPLEAEDGKAGREIGILVHALLESLGGVRERPDGGLVQRRAEESAAEMEMELSASDRERATRLALAAWESPTADRLGSVDAEREAPFFFGSDGVVVTGVMDLVCRTDEGWLVTDYKTNALRGRAVAEAAEPYELQWQVYGLAALRAGAPSVQVDLVFLEKPDEPATVRYAREDTARLEHALSNAFSGLREGEFSRRIGDRCGFCPVAEVCRSMVGD